MDKKEVKEILLQMDLPRMRVENEDWSWLLRNIRIRNSDHSKINEIIEFIKKELN